MKRKGLARFLTVMDSPVALESSNVRTGVSRGAPPAPSNGFVVQTIMDALRPGTAMSAGRGGTAMAMSVVEMVAVLFASARAPRGAATNWNASVLISNVSLAAMPAFGRAARSRNVFLMSSAGIEAGRFSAIAVSCPGSAGGPANRSVRKPCSAVEFPRTAAASPNCDDGVAVSVGVIVTVMEGLDEVVMEGLIEGLVEGLLDVVWVDDFVDVSVFVGVVVWL